MTASSIDKKHPVVFGPLLTVTLLLALLQLDSVRAQLFSFTPEDKSAVFNDYLVQSEGSSPDQVQSLFDGTPSLYAEGLTQDAYALPLEREALRSRTGRSPTFGYLINQAPQQFQIGTADVDKILDIVKQLNLNQQENRDIQLGTTQEEGEDLSDDSISGPINDPREYEAAEDLANSAVGHKLPQSVNRSSIFKGLLPIDLDTILDELKEQSRANQPRVEDENTSSAFESDSKRETSTSASRYGDGEYIDHPLALIGHQYMQGGAGEGRQLLGPDGTFENVQVVKSDHAVPSYCSPPNPCPIGFTAKDGCLEQFINSASFSREYQAKQQCSCDNEHSLFNCASPVTSGEGDTYSQKSNEIGIDSPAPAGSGVDDSSQNQHQNPKQKDRLLNTLARTIQNRFGTLDSVRNLIMGHEEGQHINNGITVE